MNDNSTAQAIINAIQRDDEKDDEIKNAIEEADKYLRCDGGKKPEFFDEFIENTKKGLIDTINGCIRVRNKTKNNKKAKDDIKKYKEGYFNEIIQNANDVVCMTNKENPEVTITVSKEDNADNKCTTYTVKCKYPDRGFSLENIYGFCTRGNSDKKSENGQEGMYGIGIKSLFCFVDKFEIDSNIHIQISSSARGRKLDTVKLFKKEERNPESTILSFSFTYWKDEELNKNEHAGFNVKKLVEFIDEVYEDNEDPSRFNIFFLDGQDDKIVFDARSLFFTELRGENRTSKNSIKKIEFKKEGIEKSVLTIETKEQLIETKEQLIETKEQLIETNDDNITIKTVGLIINNKTEEDNKYLLFHYKKEQISVAFKYNQGTDVLEDRLYSTYFINTYKKTFFGKKTGCLLNTEAINSSRSGLERENDNEPEILEIIKDKGSDTIEILCSLTKTTDKSDKNKDVFMDVLCQLIWIFRDTVEEQEGLLPQFEIFNKKNIDKIVDAVKNWTFRGKDSENSYKYILKKEDDVDNSEKIIRKNCPLDADEENVKALYKVYKKYFVPGKHDDIILCNSDNYGKLSEGIKNLCNDIFESIDNNEDRWIMAIPGLPFLKDVGDVIKGRIGRDDFENFGKIHNYLQNEIEDEHKIFVKQLISRFEVSKCFDYMGNYSADNIKEWLFGNDDNINDEAYLNAVKKFYNDESYEGLKTCVKNKIKNAFYDLSLHHNASSDWWYKDYTNCNKDFQSDSVNDDVVIKLLGLIADSRLYIGYKDSCYINYREQFIHDRSKNITLRNTDSIGNDRKKANYDWKSFKYFSLDILDRNMSDFNNFVIARALIDKYNNLAKEKYNEKYNEKYYEKYRIKYINGCDINSIKIADIENIFKWLVGQIENLKDEGDSFPLKINIKQIDDFEGQSQKESVLIKFVKKFIGDDVFIKIDSISVKNNGKNFIGFLTNIDNNNAIKAYIKRDAGSQFIPVGEGEGDENKKKFLLIYSSYKNEQEIMNEVLGSLGYDKEICDYVKHFVISGNTKILSSAMYERFIKRERLTYKYPFKYEEIDKSNITKDLSQEDIYDILSGEMSYDDHCPICNSIPTLNINDGNIKRLEKRNSMIAMLSAKYNDKNIYVKIPCCKSCFEEYKDSLTEAKIEDINEKSYKKMTLKNTISTGERSRDLINEVLISPDNWEIICQFNNMSE